MDVLRYQIRATQNELSNNFLASWFLLKRKYPTNAKSIESVR